MTYSFPFETQAWQRHALPCLMYLENTRSYRSVNSLHRASASHGVIDRQDDHRSDNRDDHASHVKAGDPRITEQVRDESTDDRSNDAENDVAHHSFALLVD